MNMLVVVVFFLSEAAAAKLKRTMAGLFLPRYPCVASFACQLLSRGYQSELSGSRMHGPLWSSWLVCRWYAPQDHMGSDLLWARHIHAYITCRSGSCSHLQVLELNSYLMLRSAFCVVVVNVACFRFKCELVMVLNWPACVIEQPSHLS